MNRRFALLYLFTIIGGAGAFGAACSSSDSSANGGGDDAGTTDASSGDGASDGAAHDAAFDSAGGDSGDGGIVGNCSPTKGPCDLVTQNCPQGQECVVVQAQGGGYATKCNPVQASEHIPLGATCCPGQSNPCLPGLECVGASCVDGSAPTARCTPHCCAGNDSTCGMSPEGYTGHCDLTVTSGGANPVDLYNACTYAQACRPFGVVRCANDFVCIIEDSQGSAKCVEIFTPDGGAGYAEGQRCDFANECADGLNCLVSGDAGTCTMLCLVPNSMPPFDAGALDGGPFSGGCTGQKKCVGVNIFPSWLGICQ